MGNHLRRTIFAIHLRGRANTRSSRGNCGSRLRPVLFAVRRWKPFFVHRTMHNVPFLWRLHRVHHSAEILTPLTLFRVHPLESIIYFLRGLFVFGLVSGVFIWLFGRELTFFHILGVDALGFIFNLAGANLRHSHIWLSFGRFENYFISPAQHQFHHSKDHGHPNFGTYLAFWDRINGSLKKTSPKPAHLKFGLGNGQYEDSVSLAPPINQSVGT